uniref:Uncharacterized protein n=1 Tax=Romanomermis culicivorax TaxID=13658 RepID=A0A915HL91_ROMCU
MDTKDIERPSTIAQSGNNEDNLREKMSYNMLVTEKNEIKYTLLVQLPRVRALYCITGKEATVEDRRNRCLLVRKKTLIPPSPKNCPMQTSMKKIGVAAINQQINIWLTAAVFVAKILRIEIVGLCIKSTIDGMHEMRCILKQINT